MASRKFETTKHRQTLNRKIVSKAMHRPVALARGHKPGGQLVQRSVSRITKAQLDSGRSRQGPAELLHCITRSCLRCFLYFGEVPFKLRLYADVLVISRLPIAFCDVLYFA